MAKKQETVSISYKEILVLAIKELDQEIDDYEAKGKGKGTEAQELITNITQPLRDKREKVKALYLIETGVEYT